MNTEKKSFILLALAFTVLMSLPFLVTGMGWTALFGLVPLLCMERIATRNGTRNFWWWHYLTFVLWNAVTTWWVCEATVGGGIFAIVANALQMSLVFGLFRWSRRRMGGALPYLLLAAAWLAWEKYYLTIAQISWPWLVLGNCFADTTALIQWYEVTGHMGGSLWIWASNLAIFGIITAIWEGKIKNWNAKARIAAIAGTVAAVFGPMIWSACIKPAPEAKEKVKVAIIQPNFDPYQKHTSMTQDQQDSVFFSILATAGEVTDSGEPSLVVGPETFTNRFIIEDYSNNTTFLRFQHWLKEHPRCNVLFGASAYNRTYSVTQPNILAYDLGETYVDGARKHIWYLSRNSAIITDTTGRLDIFHKKKLVPGTELTHYPRIFIPIEKLFGGNLIGKCAGQGGKASALKFIDPELEFKLGCAICYESVYGEYCTGYVHDGADLMTVITNDAWWGNTPGYRQHFNFSRLRAIETGRTVVRCGNTGISAIIDPDGKVLKRTEWWKPALLTGEAGLYDGRTFFVRYGDIVGRVSVFAFILLLLAAIFRPRKDVRRPSGRGRRSPSGSASADRPYRNSRTSR